MSSPWLARPASTEHGPGHASYIALVPPGDLLDLLARQLSEVAALRQLPPDKWSHRYAPGKWSVLEVFGHAIDAERVFADRALRIARGDQQPLPGFDENTYVELARFPDTTTPPQLLDQFHHLRSANLILLQTFPPETLLRRGTANNSPVTVRALAAIMVGHLHHHLTILRTRYACDF